MKILIITPGILPVPAAKGGAVENLIDILLNDDGVCKKHDITIYTIKYKDTTNHNYNIKYINTNKFIYKLRKIFRFLINKIPNFYIGNAFIKSVVLDIKRSNEEYDLIIVENQPLFGLILEKEKLASKTILHLHNDYLNIDSKLAYRTKKSYDAIFSISEAISNRVRDIDGDDKNQYVLYNGIDISRFNSKLFDSKSIRKKYGFRDKDFIFMYSGRLVPEKGVEELIDAFLRIRNNNVKLLIVGRKCKENYYNKLLEKAKLSNKRIVFVNNVEYSFIPELYSIADVGVVPSKWLEPFGLVIVEFLAASVPVIVSDVGAAKEILDLKNRSGLLVECDDYFVDNLTNTINIFLNMDKITFNSYKKNALMNSKRFSKDKYIKDFLTKIERV